MMLPPEAENLQFLILRCFKYYRSYGEGGWGFPGACGFTMVERLDRLAAQQVAGSGFSWRVPLDER